jgi:hypothetical protein
MLPGGQTIIVEELSGLNLELNSLQENPDFTEVGRTRNK